MNGGILDESATKADVRLAVVMSTACEIAVDREAPAEPIVANAAPSVLPCSATISPGVVPVTAAPNLVITTKDGSPPQVQLGLAYVVAEPPVPKAPDAALTASWFRICRTLVIKVFVLYQLVTTLNSTKTLKSTVSAITGWPDSFICTTFTSVGVMSLANPPKV